MKTFSAPFSRTRWPFFHGPKAKVTRTKKNLGARGGGIKKFSLASAGRGKTKKSRGGDGSISKQRERRKRVQNAATKNKKATGYSVVGRI